MDAATASVEFEKMFRTTPEDAAATIIKGVKDNRRRILIGPDAVVIDTMARLLPGGYQRLMSRALAEWPLCEVVVRLVLDGDSISLARVAIGGVANIPFRLPEVEALLEGRPATDETLEAASQAATRRASPLPQTKYKVAMAQALVLSTLQQARDDGVGGLGYAM